jgi:hypothetical protein
VAAVATSCRRPRTDLLTDVVGIGVDTSTGHSSPASDPAALRLKRSGDVDLSVGKEPLEKNRRVHKDGRVVAVTVRVTTLNGPLAGAYYVEQLPAYYLDASEPRGVWLGSGAALLGLHHSSSERLRRGLSPLDVTWPASIH